MNDLKQEPETRIEQRDMMDITDPHKQKNLATNQGVRFYFNRQMNSLESAMMARLTQEMEEAYRVMDDMRRDIDFAVQEMNRLHDQVMYLESRWYERIMRYLEWDILTFRIWLFERWHTGKNPIPEEPKNTLEMEVQVNALPVIEKSEPFTQEDLDALEQAGAEMSVFSDDIAPDQRA